MYKNLESRIKFYWKTIEHTLNVILAHTLNVIFDHTLNVILGFVPRIHAKQNLSRHYQACPDNLDPRDKPEDDNRMRMFFKPEDDKDMRLSTSILKHLLNVILGFIPRIYAKQNLSRHYRACPDNLDPRVEPEDDNRMRMFFKSEDDKGLRLSTSILKHTLNVILGFIPRIYAKHYPLLNTLVKPEYCK